MRFYGNGVVWNAEEDRRLCKFNNGVFNTTDQRVIDKLLSLGYKSDCVSAEEPVQAQKPIYRMNTAELEALAEEKGIDISDCKNNRERMEKLK